MTIILKLYVHLPAISILHLHCHQPPTNRAVHRCHNNLEQRLAEHYFNKGKPKTFAGKYYCYNLVHYEEFQYINDAIAREKEIKGWSRKKKKILLNPKTLIGLS